MNALVRPMNPARRRCVHHINAKGRSNDDTLEFDTQGSSHWDGLRHYPYQETLQYYNGVQQSDISGNSCLGVHNAAKNGIVARGVLLDWARHARRNGIEYDALAQYAIPLHQLREVARVQKVVFRRGDVLMICTGWTEAYAALSQEEKLALPDRAVRASCGVEDGVEALQWHWEQGFAAVASDTVAYEVRPSPRTAGVSMHEVFLSGWGMMIGESWDLEELGRKCHELGTWTYRRCCLRNPGNGTKP